ncbi:unnamed protein product [Bursaphelenchus xylophilus]|uniref:(pine wood nematode) hypothetical protein n=1 Tax=Bursaphelenchus xylophilus TaxID=6326 RepID=A0A1I7RN16_BURXY|nr:unnamed protein product [Bursaphelenchus xylophilus]CAG9087785.1 unnamed protein product [Bursaphelenchus xylophilus]
MSANSAEIPLNIECFMNDVDSRILTNDRALVPENPKSPQRSAPRLQNLQDIAEVELIGGSSQISFAKQIDQHLTQQIFKRNDHFPSFKPLPLHRVEPFTIAAHYENPQEIPYTEPRSVLERNFRCYDADRNPI